jgi:hypothetical protein
MLPFVSALIISLSFSGCGFVERTMHPSMFYTNTMNLEREVKIFGPENAKIYYSMTNREPQLYGIINDGVCSLNLTKSTSKTEGVSTWNSASELYNDVNNIRYTNQWNAVETLTLIIKLDDKELLNNKFENFWGFRSFTGYTFEDIKKWDIVESVKSDYKYRGNSKYNQEDIWDIKYRALIVDLTSNS